LEDDRGIATAATSTTAALACGRNVEAVLRRRAIGATADRIGAETEPCERLPDQTNVLAAANVVRRLNDAVANLREGRIAGGVLQTFVDIQHRALIAGAAGGVVQVGIEAPLVDQRPIHLPRGLRPHRADAVRNGHAVDAC